MTRPADYLRDPNLCRDGMGADLTTSVMAEWANGQNTLQIAITLFEPDADDLEWFEALVTAVLHAEQDRRYRDRAVRALAPA